MIRKLAQAFTLVASVVAFFGAQATTYNVVQVLDGGPNFQASLLHGATEDNRTGGRILDWFEKVSGTYDDDSNILDVRFHTKNGGTVNFLGSLNFADTGYLSGHNYLKMTTSLDYGWREAGMYKMKFSGNGTSSMCCGLWGPNSLKDIGGGMLVMTLWGAGPRTESVSIYRDGKWVEKYPLIGTDIQIKLTEVPIPGALVLFATGLAGLIGLRRRRGSLAA